MAEILRASPLPQDGPSSVLSDGEANQHSGHDDPSAGQNGNDHRGQADLINGSAPTATAGGDQPSKDETAKAGPSSPAKAKTMLSDGSKIKPINTTAKPGIKPGPPTPLVKKILNSGTFGSGAGKPSIAKPAAPQPAESVNEPAKASSPPAPPSPTKPVTAVPPPPNRRSTLAAPSSTTASKDTPVSSAAAASRRISLAPSAATASAAKTNGTSGIAKPSASKAPVTKSSPTAASAKPTAGVSAPRKSIASPTPSSSSAKAPIAKSRLSAGGSVPPPAARAAPKPAASTSTAPTTAKPAKSPASKTTSSTLSEVKEDHKVDAELEQKYRDAVAEVASKAEQIAALEVELASIRSTLDEKLAEMGQRTAELEGLQKETASGSEARDTLEAEVKRLHSVADDLQAEQEAKIAAHESELQTLRADLEASNAKVSSLEEAKSNLEASLTLAQEQLSAAQTAQGEDSAAAAIEHEALLKAKADLEAIQVETNNLLASHALEKADYEQTVASLKTHVTIVEGSVESTRSELTILKREREDTSQKLAELEVEVLELKEAAEKADDSNIKEIASLKSSFSAEKEQLKLDLEANLATAIASHQAAEQKWEEAVKATGEQHSAEVLKAIKDAEEAAHAANLKSQEALAADHAEALWAKEVEWLQKIEDTKNASETQRQELEGEVKKLAVELESQEAKYGAKVDAVKVEHEELLKKAFADAKSEAGAEHQKELAVLREEFQATLNQVNESHKIQLSALESSSKDDQQELAKGLEKKISTLTVELTATRDDLTKAKGSNSSLTSEILTLKEQLVAAQEAAQLAATDAANAQVEYIESLNKQLANTQTELSDMQEALKMNQLNFAEELDQIKKNHTAELEEASKARVKALDELQLANDDRLAKVKLELAQLQANIEDERNAKQQAEAQLATLQSQIPPSAPKASAATLSKEEHKAELQTLHRAHDQKMEEKEAEYRNALKAEKERFEELIKEKGELEDSISRKEMERQMFETEAEDLGEENKKLAAEVEHLREQLNAKA